MRRASVVSVVAFAVISCRGWGVLRTSDDVEAAEAACQEGNQLACGAVADALVSAGRYQRAWPLALTSCDAGVALGCGAAGKMALNGSGPAPEDDAFAATALGFACDRGSGAACVDQGLALLDLKQPEAAAAASLKGCDAGELMGCSNYGYLINEVWEGHLDHVAARRIFVDTCDAGLIPGCRRAGVSLIEGRGGAPDWDGGRALLEVACYARDGRGCLALGLALTDAGATDEGLRFLRRGCAFGDGCGAFAHALFFKGVDGGPALYELADSAVKGCHQTAYECGLSAHVKTLPGVEDWEGAIEAARAGCRALPKCSTSGRPWCEAELTQACRLLDERDAGRAR